MNQLGRPYGHIEQTTRKPVDHYRTFLELVPYLVDQARQVLPDDAHSYRGFHVAGANYAINPYTKEFDVASAGNLKRKPNTKVCAEKKMTRRCEKNGLTLIIGMVVLGTTDVDKIEGVIGIRTPTLLLCPECSDQLDNYAPIENHTLIVSSGIDSDVNQTFMYGQLRRLYDSTLPADHLDLQVANRNFDSWEQRIAKYDRYMADIKEPTSEIRARLAQIALTTDPLAA